MEKGKVQTVLGTITPDELGITLCHEHLSMTYEVFYTEADAEHKAMEDAPFILENLGWIRQNPYSHKSNLIIADSADAIIEEVKEFKANGGGSIVENSTLGLNRDLRTVQKISKVSGVNVVAGTGYYVGHSLPSTFDSWSEEHLIREMTADLTEGVGEMGIKCGVIGELGCSYPLADREKKSLRASGHVQEELGCPVIIHPGRSQNGLNDILRILLEAGADPRKIVMSHLDRTLLTKEALLDFATSGLFCEFDLFGIEVSHYQLHPTTDMPGDAERIERIKWLLDDGREDQVLIAHDVHTKHRLKHFGGHGYSHILENVVPMMLNRGLSRKNIDHILIENPKRWLTV